VSPPESRRSTAKQHTVLEVVQENFRSAQQLHLDIRRQRELRIGLNSVYRCTLAVDRIVVILRVADGSRCSIAGARNRTAVATAAEASAVSAFSTLGHGPGRAAVRGQPNLCRHARGVHEGQTPQAYDAEGQASFVVFLAAALAAGW
jgi:hypothetical protein